MNYNYNYHSSYITQKDKPINKTKQYESQEESETNTENKRLLS